MSEVLFSIGLEEQPAIGSAEALAIEIAESKPDMTVDQIIDRVRIRLKDESFQVEELKATIEAHREKIRQDEAEFEAENWLYQKILTPVQASIRMMIRRGVLNPESEMYFASQVNKNEQEIKAKLQAVAKEKRADLGLQILVELANAPHYGQSKERGEDIAVDSPHADYETVSKVKRLSPKLFTYQRSLELNKFKTTNLEKILVVNPELSVNQVINILDSFIEEKIAELWEERTGEAGQFMYLSKEEYEAFEKEVSGDKKLMELQTQLKEFVEKHEAWKVDFKKRFDAMPSLHPGVTWEVVEASLEKDHSAEMKLMKLDAAGFEMNVFKSKNPAEIIFRTAQLDVTKIDPKYRTIMYDSQAQMDHLEDDLDLNGNAVEIAASLGVELADPELYGQSREVLYGWFWLKTDDDTRKIGRAFDGSDFGPMRNFVSNYSGNGSFCAALRVKKAILKKRTPEVQRWFEELRARFDAMPELHAGVTWEEVEASLDKDQSAVEKLMKLDAAGFEMNVFKSKDPTEIVFRMAQLDVTRIDAKYRTIMYDNQAQMDYHTYRVNGNALDIASSLDVEMADLELYKRFRVRIGLVYLKTDDITREHGSAFLGGIHGVGKYNIDSYGDAVSFCASLRVKKA